jgi:hypothetical protein
MIDAGTHAVGVQTGGARHAGDHSRRMADSHNHSQAGNHSHWRHSARYSHRSCFVRTLPGTRIRRCRIARQPVGPRQTQPWTTRLRQPTTPPWSMVCCGSSQPPLGMLNKFKLIRKWAIPGATSNGRIGGLNRGLHLLTLADIASPQFVPFSSNLLWIVPVLLRFLLRILLRGLVCFEAFHHAPRKSDFR